MAERAASWKGPFKAMAVNLNRAQPVCGHNQLSRCRRGLGRGWNFAKEGRQSEREGPGREGPKQGSNYHDGLGKLSCYRTRVVTRAGSGAVRRWQAQQIEVPWTDKGLLASWYPKKGAAVRGRGGQRVSFLKWRFVLDCVPNPQNTIYRKAFGSQVKIH